MLLSEVERYEKAASTGSISMAGGRQKWQENEAHADRQTEKAVIPDRARMHNLKNISVNFI